MSLVRVMCIIRHEKPMNHPEKLQKYIWTLPVKLYFTNTNSFTKVMCLPANSDM